MYTINILKLDFKPLKLGLYNKNIKYRKNMN